VFTGIVQKLVKINSIDKKANLIRLGLGLDDIAEGLELGASVAINGVCLTVSEIAENLVYFDVIPETLETTNLNSLSVSSLVNVERSYKVGDEIGGHIVSGHIGTTAPLITLVHEQYDRVFTFKVADSWMKYIFHKGFIAIDGASLTVSAVDRSNSTFSVSLIPETIARTTLGLIQLKDEVNIEVEAQTVSIVETVERVMAER
tara:strand:- start:191 stop:799 length:609 start_codon:yes stop_codon:yes gene_type:complete